MKTQILPPDSPTPDPGINYAYLNRQLRLYEQAHDNAFKDECLYRIGSHLDLLFPRDEQQLSGETRLYLMGVARGWLLARQQTNDHSIDWAYVANGGRV